MVEVPRRTDAARYKIEQLLDLVTSGRIRVPRFQRGLRWTSNDVERLFDSIYKGYPVGTLLLWQRPAVEDRVQLGGISIDAPARDDALWVVDGQQRITALASALLPRGSGNEGGFELAFDLATERFVRLPPHDTRETRLPLREAYDLQKVLAWLRERNLEDELQDRAFRLADHLRNFEIPAYIVTSEDETSLRQIFDRVNTFGKQMTRAEVFHALNTSAQPGGQDLRTLSEDIGALGFGEIKDNTLLFCVLAVRAPDVFREFRSEFDSDADLGAALDDARGAIERTIEFLRDEAQVPHLSVVPYQHLLVGLVRFFGLHDNVTDWDRVLLRRWFWRSAVHGPLAKLGSTGTLRATLNAIGSGEAYQSASALLEMIPSGPLTVEIGQFRWNIADARATIAALAILQPIDLVSGEEISTTESVDRLGKDSLAVLFKSESGDLWRTAANRVFVGTEAGALASSDELVSALLAAPPATLASHAITDPALNALLGGNETAFLQRRKQDLETLVNEFVGARAEWERSTRPPIQRLQFADS